MYIFSKLTEYAKVNHNSFAFAIVGKIYKSEKIVSRDLNTAIKYFAQSAKLGCTLGYYYLGKEYFYGRYLKVNYLKAQKYLFIALKDEPHAGYYLYKILKHMHHQSKESDNNYIDISMKGKNSEEWQNLTGTDGFETQQEALKNLSLLPIEFTSSMVITPENVHSFCESVRIAYQNGARQFSFTFQIDNEDSQEKNLEYLQKHDPIRLVDNFLMQIDDLSQITNDWWIEYSFPLCVYSKKQLTLLKGHLADPCQIHTNNSITVNTNLDLFHCDMFFSNSIGKFKKDFTTSTELIQFLEKHTYTATLPDFCSECKLLEKCYGGCPVLQKHYSIEALKEFKEVKKKPTL